MNGSITIRLQELGIAEQHETAVDSQPSETSVSDEALIADVCLGSREALGILFRRYSRLVRGVALRVLKDASEADDLVQDVFLLIHRLCKTFDSSRASAQFWILQMAFRRAISRRRYLNSRHFYTQVGSVLPSRSSASRKQSGSGTPAGSGTCRASRTRRCAPGGARASTR